MLLIYAIKMQIKPEAETVRSFRPDICRLTDI